MSAEADLQHAYAEWRRLADAEGRAIRAGNWEFVAECQQALEQLKPIINQLTCESTQQPLASDLNWPARRTSTRATILDLIELQRRNLLSLQQRRQRLSKHIEQLSRADRNLRSIQRSYAPPPPAAWTSYS